MRSLPENGLKVINIGLYSFYEALKQQDVEVVQVEWTPPASGDQELLRLLADLKE
jgi:hypothetical protein